MKQGHAAALAGWRKSAGCFVSIDDVLNGRFCDIVVKETSWPYADRDSFVCVGSYSRKHNKVGDPPEEYAAAASRAEETANKAEGVPASGTAGKSSVMVPTGKAGASG